MNTSREGYAIRTSDNSLGCVLKAPSGFHIESQIQCGYEKETMLYAVCRYINHSAELKDPLIRESNKYSLAEYKTQTSSHTICTEASKMELPGGRAKINLEVTKGEIRILKLVIENNRVNEWSEIDLELAHKYSSNHKPELERDSLCGCFYCGTIFSPQEINNWIIAETPIDYRGTAVCPYCGIDSVIGVSSGYPITKDFLGRMSQKWFFGASFTRESEDKSHVNSDKIENKEASNILSVCYDIREDKDTPSPLSMDAYEALIRGKRQLIEPDGRRSPMLEEYCSYQFKTEDDRNHYMQYDIVPRAYSMAAIIVRKYKR